MIVRLLATASGLALIGAGAAWAEDWRSSYTIYGMPGLIEMPTAGSMPDAHMAATLGYFGDHTRGTVSFQITPRLTGSFRYSRMANLDHISDKYADRSMDLQYRLLDEGAYRPAVAVGLRDFLGTGIYSSEYLVASKTFGSRLQATAGIGWGQMGSRNGFDNPLSGLFGDEFDERTFATPEEKTGGTLSDRQFFRGDAAFFGGLEYTVSSSWRVLAEYSSDGYRLPNEESYVEADSPMNFGVSYSPNEQVQLGAYYMYGNQVGFSATYVIDPTTRYATQGRDPAPIPVSAAPSSAAGLQGGARYDAAITDPLAEAMAKEGLRLIGVSTGGGEMRVRYENDRYRAEAQGAGRLARILSHVAPASVTRFRLEPSTEGMPKSAIVINRADLVSLENELDAADRLRARSAITTPASAAGLTRAEDPRDRFSWSIGPDLNLSVFGGSRLSYQLGIKASASYRLRPGLELSGKISQRLSRSDTDPTVTDPAPDETDVPVVRRDLGYYRLADGPQLEHLTLTSYANPAPGVYTRATGGYLERMYGGVSGEILWKPAGSRLGLGAEVTYAAKRDYEGLGFGDYDTVTGFVSAYYEFENDFVGRVDLGRYLAGDWGGTLSVSRELPNGWKFGGYMTLTDIPFDEFGEGSFDKGVMISIPTDWILGTPSREARAVRLRSLNRDGGRRVSTGAGLYNMVRDGQIDHLDDSWGRFWQ